MRASMEVGCIGVGGAARAVEGADVESGGVTCGDGAACIDMSNDCAMTAS